MTRNLLSDHTGAICPEVLQAMIDANKGQAAGFGADPISQRVDAAFSELFSREVRVFPVVTGSAGNALALATLCPPYGAIFCHELAHIERDECGAPEFFTQGAKLTLVPGNAGKVDPAALEAKLSMFESSVHMVVPSVLSLTQATELGSVYSTDELRTLTTIAHDQGLKVHMDGARLANAIVGADSSWAEMTWRSGVDVLTFGSTKNGTMCGDAVVFFDPDLLGDFEIRRKRAGHFVSKMRFLSAQLLAYVETGVWRENATRTNRLARKVADAAGELLLSPVDANEVFLAMPPPLAKSLSEAGFSFMSFNFGGQPIARFVLSWDQKEEDIEQLTNLLEESACE